VEARYPADSARHPAGHSVKHTSENKPVPFLCYNPYEVLCCSHIRKEASPLFLPLILTIIFYSIGSLILRDNVSIVMIFRSEIPASVSPQVEYEHPIEIPSPVLVGFGVTQHNNASRIGISSSPILLQDVDYAQHNLVCGCRDAVTLSQLHHLSGKNLDLRFASCLNIL
jgi:hypothetical protein